MSSTSIEPVFWRLKAWRDNFYASFDVADHTSGVIDDRARNGIAADIWIRIGDAVPPPTFNQIDVNGLSIKHN